MELANGCVGYVPTTDAFLPAGGGYETRLTSYSNLGVCAGDRIVAGSRRLAHALTPAPLPHRAPPEPSWPDHEWDYGNNPPELS